MNLTIPDKPGQLYARMQTAICKCESVDDCKEIADQAHAIAAYFKQIKDDESLRKFIIIKLRAYRRIGEILFAVDTGDCETEVAQIAKLRQAIPEMRLSDHYISQALRIGEMPADFFDREITQCGSVSGLLNAYQHFLHDEWKESPAGKAELARREKQAEKDRAEREADAAERRQQESAERAQYQDLKEAQAEAFSDVGFSLTRHDRENMRQVVFLIKKPVYEVLRQAAFDRRVTMQAILRAGLKMWLVANGYDGDDLSPATKPTNDIQDATASPAAPSSRTMQA